MLRPDRLIRAGVTLPFTIARRVVRIAAGLLPGGDEESPERAPAVAPDVEVAEAADDALTRDREPVEHAALAPDDPLTGHVEAETELMAESADAEAPEPAGAELHVDEPWDGYRRMKVAEIRAHLDGQSAEVLAAVELYETTHRNRTSVLEAVRAATRA